MKLTAAVLDGLTVVYPDAAPESCPADFPPLLRNEAFSFQAALRPDIAPGESEWITLIPEVDSPLADRIRVYTVELTPTVRVGYAGTDDWMDRRTPGLYPDRLHPLAPGEALTVPAGFWKSVWFQLNEEAVPLEPGVYPVTVRFLSGGMNWRGETLPREELARVQFSLTVLPVCLPPQQIIATNWLHYDCMAHFSGAAPWTDRFWTVVGRYLRLAAQNGQNMALVPAFTPPLDTPIGQERQTVQLIGVEKKNGGYAFDFSDLERFVDLARDCGIRYFEHSHLFTQWGAEHAPKIVATENGRTVRLFGWDTAADSPDYRAFLHAYLTELKIFLREKGLTQSFFFHISDEPAPQWLESYRSAAAFLHRELESLPSGDALSEFRFYEEGLVQTPIVASNRIDAFLGKAAPLWLYFTGGQSGSYLPNRLIGMSPVRSRILGWQLYDLNLQGFLHWGFNAHHNTLSRRILDPRISGDMGGDFSGGTSYLVYPDGENVEPSIRLAAFRDAMQDARALALLESRIGRAAVRALIRRTVPDFSLHCKLSAPQMRALSRSVREALFKHQSE